LISTFPSALIERMFSSPPLRAYPSDFTIDQKIGHLAAFVFLKSSTGFVELVYFAAFLGVAVKL